RVRLDHLLVERGLAASGSEAQALVLAGRVRVDGAGGRVLKAGQLVAGDIGVSVSSGPRFASRAADKLVAALDAFGIDVSGSVCLDAGASTGGFTDVLLERGAARVYAVDVGRAQLVERLRTDARVVSMERTNLRTLTALPELVDLATLDLSFISLRLVLPTVRRLLIAGGRVVALVKPQFEAGRTDVPRGGVVRDPAVHRSVLLRFATDAAAAGFSATDLIPSPLTGHEGNREFLAVLRAADLDRAVADWAARVDRAVGPTVGA
ncbi:MAG: TlyA family RNA methyltransferase, partial [Chloroflexota bacterium]|nr:TlyA family RNA methyltransferase [Chloroflexota bacterium]